MRSFELSAAMVQIWSWSFLNMSSIPGSFVLSIARSMSESMHWRLLRRGQSQSVGTLMGPCTSMPDIIGIRIKGT